MNENLPQSPDQMTDILDIETILLNPWSKLIAWAPWVLGTCVFLILAFLLYRFLRGRFGDVSKLRTPYERAQKDLKTLRESRKLENKEWQAFYFALTEILKRYIHDENGIDILDKTTEEILSLKKQILKFASEYEWESLKILFARADQVKFAKIPATPEQARADCEFVAKWVTSHRKPASISEERGEKSER